MNHAVGWRRVLTTLALLAIAACGASGDDLADARIRAVDAPNASVDAPTATIDSGAPSADASSAQNDAMTLPIDARVSSADAAPAPLDAPTAIPDAQPGNPDAGVVARCGNGIVEASEQCDDGNSSNIDSCTTTCLSTIVTSADDSGPGTLRALALAVPDGTRLTFDVSLSGKTILLTSPIALPSNLAIVGLGAQQLTIDGGGANQILTPAATLSISGLTLQHGLATSLTGGPSLGAAIGCSTELHVDGCAFNANLANNGGALCISGPATISNSSFDSNSSEFGGGAIFMNGHGTTTTISNTTIANSTSPQGSAINVNGGTLSMTNSTIANSSGDSGTILNIDTTELAFVTVTGSTGYPALYNAGNAFSIKNSIVANNPAGDFVGFSAIESGDYNVIDNDGAIVSTQGHDAIGGTTALSDLADNGGTGKTQSITVDSAAFDSIPAPLCTDWSGASVSTDERGAARPVDATCDAGAFERQATDVPLPDCGNGTREVGEECDDGVSNDNNGACLLTCKVARCGDGFIESNVEICDDGSNGPGTCCAADCGGDLTCSLNQSNPTTGAIAGGIIWNGLPAAGNSLFMLSLPNGTGDTITNGSYAFGSLAPATYHLELCSSGNEAPTLVQSDVEVTAGTSTASNLDITAVAGRVTGTVTENGLPVAQAQVVNLGCCEFFADDNGNFEFYLPTGDYTVNVSSPSTFLGTTSFSVTDGLATDVGVVDFGG